MAGVGIIVDLVGDTCLQEARSKVLLARSLGSFSRPLPPQEALEKYSVPGFAGVKR